jgi:O-antigen/teichoic acid export membrane protein
VAGDGLRRRSFVVRYLTLFGGEVVSKLCVMAAYAYLARVLGPRDFGVIELALSTTLFFVLAAEAGLGNYAARSVETSPGSASQLIPRAGLLRAMLAVPAYLIILALASWNGTTGLGLLAIYGGAVLLTPFNTQFVFQGLRQMQWVATGNLLRYGTFAALVLFIVRRGSSVRIVALAEVGGVLALAIFNSALLRRVLRTRLDWRGAWHGARELFRKTWFLGASDLTWAAMWYSPTIIVGWTDPGHAEQVAWIAAAVRIVLALHQFVFLYFFNLIPNLAKELHESVEDWRALIHRSISVSMWAACFVALGGLWFAPIILRTLFGAAYGQAVLPFQIAIWMIPAAWLGGHFRGSLIVGGHQRLEFLASAIAGITTVVLAWEGARRYGAPGAAFALVAGGAVYALVSGIAVSRAIGAFRPGTAAPALLTCLGAMLIGSSATWLIGRAAGITVACGFYTAVAASQWDLARLRHAWEGQSF